MHVKLQKKATELVAFCREMRKFLADVLALDGFSLNSNCSESNGYLFSMAGGCKNRIKWVGSPFTSGFGVGAD
jgi:hypothetical protein